MPAEMCAGVCKSQSWGRPREVLTDPLLVTANTNYGPLPVSVSTSLTPSGTTSADPQWAPLVETAQAVPAQPARTGSSVPPERSRTLARTAAPAWAPLGLPSRAAPPVPCAHKGAANGREASTRGAHCAFSPLGHPHVPGQRARLDPESQPIPAYPLGPGLGCSSFVLPVSIPACVDSETESSSRDRLLPELPHLLENDS